VEAQPGEEYALVARTKNPHEAAVKSWETRRKAQSGGGSNPTISPGDWMGKGTEDDPAVIIGAQIRTPMISAYLKKNGAKVQKGSPLPKDVSRGEPHECYSNATRLVMDAPDRFDYCEGFAYPDGTSLGGMAVQHAWAIDKKTGAVVDNTWDKPEESRYFGVRYDRKAYFKHLTKTKMFGVLGGDFRDAIDVIERGGL
jgi:hypothetical protein